MGEEQVSLEEPTSSPRYMALSGCCLPEEVIGCNFCKMGTSQLALTMQLGLMESHVLHTSSGDLVICLWCLLFMSFLVLHQFTPKCSAVSCSEYSDISSPRLLPDGSLRNCDRSLMLSAFDMLELEA